MEVFDFGSIEMSFLKLPLPLAALFRRIRNLSGSTALTIRTNRTADKNQQSVEDLRLHMARIDHEIRDTQHNYIAAQAVSIRTQLSGPNGFWLNLQKRRHYSEAQGSAQWHWHHLQELIKIRIRLNQQIDRLTGQLWPKRIRFWFTLFSLLLFGLAGLGLLFLSLITAIYLIPVWLSMLLIYYILTKRANKLSQR
ncbi:MAG: hypothetical protein AB8B37_06825 [Prochlorococcus sp.]